MRTSVVQWKSELFISAPEAAARLFRMWFPSFSFDEWRMKKIWKKEPDHRGHLKQEDKENKHVGCLTIWIQITETLAFILTRYVTSKLAHWGEEFNLVTFWHTCKLNFVMRIVEKNMLSPIYMPIMCVVIILKPFRVLKDSAEVESISRSFSRWEVKGV